MQAPDALVFIFRDCVDLNIICQEIVENFGNIEWHKRLREARSLLDNMEHFSRVLHGVRCAEEHVH